MSQKTRPFTPLRPWEKLTAVLFFLSVVVFGGFVEYRSSFLSRRMGDLGCYLRAAWAVRAGVDIYGLTEDNGWHYNYPPLYAILLTPLADPPSRDTAELAATSAGIAASPLGGPLPAIAVLPAGNPYTAPDVGYTTPYAVSVGVVYVLNVLCLVLAVHWLACGLERTAADPAVRTLPWGCRRWWLLRALPVLACLPPIGHTLMRGQANFILLLCVCGLIAGLLQQRRLTAGVCLAGAICLKIFPAYLLLIPFWRRDLRCVAGCALGLFVGLILIPVLVLGPQRTLNEYRQLAVVLVEPALGVGEDKTRAEELINVTATDSQSFRSIMHNTIYLDRATRPPQASPLVQKIHWVLGGAFTLLTLAIAGFRRTLTGPALALFIGSLTLVMILMSPVCHTHYFALSVPLVMGLIAWEWERTGKAGLSYAIVGLIALQIVGNTLPLLPATEVLKDVGLATYTALVLWLLACVAIRRSAHQPLAQARAVGPDLPAAA
jgi:alpha-1,2-mannosyltransferase